ncbi:hypothetical protein BGX24_005736 [Mortierella sp. AD032]|nr:hypothetical protein BGX24_005736 [Mortierella sp. AD032]
MVAFDKYTNLVLADCEEIRRIKPKQGVSSKAEQERQQKRTFGLVILRGEPCVAMSVDAPPPPSLEGQQARLPQPLHAGVASPAGRGMPVALAGPAGLMGPIRGVGKPAPGMMLSIPPPPVAHLFVFSQGVPHSGAVPPPGPGVPPFGFRSSKMRSRPFAKPLPPAPFGVPPLGMIPPLGFHPMGQPGALPLGTPPSGILPHRVPTLGVPLPGVPPPGFRPGVGSFTFPLSPRPAPRNQHTL